jgi:hypothetical protein
VISDNHTNKNNKTMDDILHRQDQKRRQMTDALFCSRKVSDARQGKGEERDHFIKRLTHLRLQDMGLAIIRNLEKTRKLQALYLNSNVITCMQGLQHKNLKRLIQLDLQDNDITVMEGLNCLTGLKRLSVARNCISFITGLENCPKLEQLDISGQRLLHPEVTAVEFDEISIESMSQSLVSLNASSCGLEHTEHLACLDNLTSLDVSNNNISNIELFKSLLASYSPRTGYQKQLRTLVTTGNPAMEAGGPRVRDTLVMMAECLKCLNGKDIDSKQRNFLMRFEARKKIPKKKSTKNSTSSSGNNGSLGGGSVLVDAGNRPMAFEDINAYQKVRSGNKPFRGNKITSGQQQQQAAFR